MSNKRRVPAGGDAFETHDTIFRVVSAKVGEFSVRQKFRMTK